MTIKNFNFNGFTLVEIIIVTIIAGIVSVCSVPAIQGLLDYAHAKDAQNNLITIYSAQKEKFANDGTYYISPTTCTQGNVVDDSANFSSNLNIIVIPNYVKYCCSSTNTFTCYADVSSQRFVLILSGNSTINVKGNYKEALTPARNPTCAGQANCP